MRRPGDFDGCWVQVYAVGYDSEVRALGAGGFTKGAEGAWVAVVQGLHGIEEVCEHCRTGLEGCGRSFVGCFGVAQGEADATRRDLGDGGGDAGEFGGGGYEGYVGWGEVRGAVAGFEVGEAVWDPVLEDGWAVDAALGRGDEGAFAVRAEGLGAF